MLTTFGRLNRDIICERDQQPDIVQTLHLISGDTIQKKLVSPKANLEKWIGDASLPDDRIIDRIFLISLTRYPDEAERVRIRQTLGDGSADSRRKAYQDVLWAILNSKAFLYNH
jgi:hypothetical protein